MWSQKHPLKVIDHFAVSSCQNKWSPVPWGAVQCWLRALTNIPTIACCASKSLLSVCYVYTALLPHCHSWSSWLHAPAYCLLFISAMSSIGTHQVSASYSGWWLTDGFSSRGPGELDTHVFMFLNSKGKGKIPGYQLTTRKDRGGGVMQQGKTGKGQARTERKRERGKVLNRMGIGNLHATNWSRLTWRHNCSLIHCLPVVSRELVDKVPILNCQLHPQHYW